MDFLPESSRDCINVDSHENRGKNSNRGIDEIKPAEFVGSISKDLNDETKGIDVKLTVFPYLSTLF